MLTLICTTIERVADRAHPPKRKPTTWRTIHATQVKRALKRAHAQLQCLHLLLRTQKLDSRGAAIFLGRTYTEPFHLTMKLSTARLRGGSRLNLSQLRLIGRGMRHQPRGASTHTCTLPRKLVSTALRVRLTGRRRTRTTRHAHERGSIAATGDDLLQPRTHRIIQWGGEITLEGQDRPPQRTGYALTRTMRQINIIGAQDANEILHVKRLARDTTGIPPVTL
jgi:hypothetical protein